jgi:hypothetical protein
MDYMTTTMDGDYTNRNPLRKRVERYRKQKMSETTWRKVQSVWERKLQNDWIVSGGADFGDWLDMNGQNHIVRISRDMDMKGEWYGL